MALHHLVESAAQAQLRQPTVAARARGRRRSGRDDPKALVVVFRGRGNTFCSGADLDQLVGPVLRRVLGFAAAGDRLGTHLRQDFQHAQADHRCSRRLCRRRRLRADDLLRFRAGRRRSEDRRFPYPARVVRRRRPDLSPAALYRHAQVQGADAHRQIADAAINAPSGAW